MKASAILLLLFLTGCFSIPAERVMLTNPNTGQVARCEKPGSVDTIVGPPYWFGVDPLGDEKAFNDCLQDYQSAGFKRIPIGQETAAR